ncbi:chromosomal replication initiator protein DnaA [Candidatus Saccharibacteria bacterium]|nr:chromosomal replication initiator protein DnaA [Candidatus Saccharibacteria bacterium]
MGQTPPDYSNIWHSVLGELEVSLSSHSFKTFLKSTELITVTDGTAIIGVPNPFSSAQIKSRFEADILQVLQRQLPDVQALGYKVQSVTSAPIDDQETLIPQTAQKPTRTKSPTKNQPYQQNSQPDLFNQQQHLIDRYNFSNFVVGSSNRLAYSAAKLVAEKPGTDYNPLFLYGPAGVGKTHMMWAVYGELKRRNPKLELLYITIEEFYKTFVDSVRKSEAFTTKYREVDVLFVDDIQFIKKKETTQEEFFHTFNSLHQANKQIVICSDRPPKEIPELEERLRSRFEWGMVVDIQPPDLETRVAIIQAKAEQKRFAIPMEVAEAIAERISTNIRELEGGFNKVLMHCELHHEAPTLALVEQILGGTASTPSGRRKPSPKQVLTETALYYGVSIEDLTGKRRNKDIVMPRQIAMYLLRSELDLSYPQIGGHLGGRDHTTVMHGCDKVETMIARQDPITHDISEVKQRLMREFAVL